MAHRYRYTQTRIQTHLYRSFIQRIQFPRILFLGCDFGLHIREILPSLRIWHTFTISFRVCVCAYVTHIRSHIRRHTHAPTTTTKRDEICVTRWTAPKKGNIFFIIPLWGACKSGNPQYTTASCARSVCNHQAKHTPRLFCLDVVVESYKYLPLASRPSFTLLPLALAGVGTNPEEPGIWDMHLPPLSSFRNTDGATIQREQGRRGTKFCWFYLIVRFFCTNIPDFSVVFSPAR